MSHDKPTFGSLFAGIGGIDLGLERAGWECRWQVELGQFSRDVLTAHWPDVPRFEDVCVVTPDDLATVDLVAGGFPCQDISSAHTAGERRGLRGDRSGLWTEFSRIVGELRPRFVLVENSPQWRRWVPEVRSDLARLGYASVPLELSAGSFGAPHRRPRCFVVADADGEGESLRAIDAEVARLQPVPAHAGPWGAALPDGVRVDDGFPRRMDRLRALGNAAVPDVLEWIGRRMIERVEHTPENENSGDHD